jgi:uncharacterized membrane protein YfcA
VSPLELIGYLACALIDISLGLIGAGGSILMIPVLVFLFDMPPILATSYSLFVVGITSFVSATGRFRAGDVLLRSALTFGFSSMVTVLFIRHFIIPYIPKHIGNIGKAIVSYDLICMMLFAFLMILAAIFMLGNTEKQDMVCTNSPGKTFRMVCYALLIGTVTGFLGAGGGFLIIPVMTLLMGLPIKKAVGTSLAIVALNSLLGFANDLGRISFDWQFLTLITIIALAGSLFGGLIAKQINSIKLKAFFALFVLSLGIILITSEIYKFLIAV